MIPSSIDPSKSLPDDRVLKARIDGIADEAIQVITRTLREQGGSGKVWVPNWGSRFGDSCGSFRKFLERHDDKFTIIPGDGRKFSVELSQGKRKRLAVESIHEKLAKWSRMEASEELGCDIANDIAFGRSGVRARKEILKKHGKELFGELLRISNYAVVDDYFKDGVWKDELMRMDYVLIEANRKQAVASCLPQILKDRQSPSGFKDIIYNSILSGIPEVSGPIVPRPASPKSKLVSMTPPTTPPWRSKREMLSTRKHAAVPSKRRWKWADGKTSEFFGNSMAPDERDVPRTRWCTPVVEDELKVDMDETPLTDPYL